MSTHEIANEVRIDAPKKRLWEVMSDFGDVANVSPGITSSQLTSEASGGVGATRHCDFTLMGSSVEERIEEWEDGESIGIHVYESKRLPFVKNQHAHFKLAEAGEGSKLVAHLRYDIGGGPVGAIMHTVMLKKQLAKGWRIFVAGVKHHAETGELVDSNTRVPVEAVSPV